MENPPATPVDEEKKYTEGILAQYNPSDAKIAALKGKHADLLKIIAENPAAAKDHEVYTAVTLARREVVKCRFPGVKSEEAASFLKEIRTALTGVATRCETWHVKPARKAKVAA